MKARDVSPSRFDVARAEATQLVGRLSEGAEVMVIETGVQPKVAAALGRDRQLALAAIGQAQARDLPNRLRGGGLGARRRVGLLPTPCMPASHHGRILLLATRAPAGSLAHLLLPGA